MNSNKKIIWAIVLVIVIVVIAIVLNMKGGYQKPGELIGEERGIAPEDVDIQAELNTIDLNGLETDIQNLDSDINKL